MTQKVPALRGCVQATWGLGVRAWGCRARIPEAPGPRQSRPPSPGDLWHPGSVSPSDNGRKKSVSRGDSPRHPGRRRLVDPLCRAGPRCPRQPCQHSGHRQHPLGNPRVGTPNVGTSFEFQTPVLQNASLRERPAADRKYLRILYRIQNLHPESVYKALSQLNNKTNNPIFKTGTRLERTFYHRQTND